MNKFLEALAIHPFSIPFFRTLGIFLARALVGSGVK